MLFLLMLCELFANQPFDDGKWYPGKYETCGIVPSHCQPKAVPFSSRGFEEKGFEEHGRAKTIGAEYTAYERERYDRRFGGIRKNWC